MWGAEGAQGTFALPLEVGAFLPAFALREGVRLRDRGEGAVSARHESDARGLPDQQGPTPPPLS